MEKKYDYGVEVTSADGYKCSISWNSCYLGNTSMPFSNTSSWGQGGAGLNSAYGDVPDSLFLVYYSLTEDQFYGLQAAIDKERVRPLLEAKYPQKDYEDATYGTFTLGLAPGGFVNLWLTGSAGKLFIESYYAKKIDYDYSSAFPVDQWSREKIVEQDSKSLYPFIKKEMAQGSISGAYWDSLNTAYPWRLAFNDSRFSLYNYDIYLINQENRDHLTDPEWAITQGDKYIPAKLVLYLQHELDPIKYKVEINIREQYIEYDDAEDTLDHMRKSRALLEFYKQFYAMMDDKDVVVYVEFDDAMQHLKLKLRTANKEMEFPFYTYKIYDSERYDIR